MGRMLPLPLGEGWGEGATSPRPMTHHPERDIDMAEKNRRRELVAEYKRSHPEAGVYRVVNSQNGKQLLGFALNLGSVRSKIEFARSTNSSSGLGALSHKLLADAR